MSIIQVPEFFNNVFGLGAPIQVFNLRKRNRWGSWFAIVLFLGGALVVFGYGLLSTFDRWQRFGPAVILKTITPPLIIAAILFLLGVWALWAMLSNVKMSAVLYSDGLAYHDRKGLQSWRYDEVATMSSAVTKHYTNGIYTGTTHIYTLVKKDGNRLVLNDSLEQIEDLANKIQDRIFPILYPLYAQEYNSGKTLTFGPVTMSKQAGITIGKKNYPWDEVKQVSIQRGFIQVAKKDGGWFSGANVSASSVPNLPVLLSLLDQITGVN